MKNIIVLILVIFLSTNLLFAQIINIPADYPTIQEGIDAAVNGDTVLVAPGIYFENIDYVGKNITLTSNFIFSNSDDDIINTIIDGRDSASVVTFKGDEDSTAVLLGFTIQNGYAESGAGIFCGKTFNGPDPFLKNLIVQNNVATSSGGGVYILNSEAVMSNSLIIGNISESNGGGICYYSNTNSGNDNLKSKIENCKIKSNTSSKGGGIFIRHTSIVLVNSIISANTSNNSGGVYVDDCNSVEIFNSDILFNYSGNSSGGLTITDCDTVLVETTNITNNTTKYLGGGLFLKDCNNAIFNNVLFSKNKCYDYESRGAAVYALFSSFKTINTTFADNSSGYDLIMLLEESSCDMINTICKTPNELSTLIVLGYYSGASYVSFSHCNVPQDYPAIMIWTVGSEIIIYDGNINEDSEFVAIGPHPYQITDTSPCADAGTIDTTGLNLPEFDLAGNPRINNQRIDMGVYEWDITVNTSEHISSTTNLNVKAFPNPFTTSTTFEYTLQQPSTVHISIFNHLGEQIAEIQREQSSGIQQIIWNADGMPLGVYFYRMHAGEQFASGKIIINR